MADGIELEIDVEHMAVTRALVQLAGATGRPLAEIIRQNSRLIAVNLAYQTQPLGDDDDARKQGENAVKRDIGYVYQTPQQAYNEIKQLRSNGRQTGERVARAFVAAIYRGDIARAYRILRSVGISREIAKFDGGAHHQRVRNRLGRVSARRAAVIVTNPGKIKTYTRKIQQRVGSAKDGWADVARQLGGARMIPHWAKRHRRVSGTLTDRTSDPDEPYVVMQNNVPWIRQVLTERQQIEALRMQREKMRKSVATTIEKLARKSGLWVQGANEPF